MAPLKEGDEAPYFEGINQDGKKITLEDFKGKKLILYFYPKDNTSGCTAEACSLNDGYSSLTEKGFEVVGVSPDSASSHLKFIAKYNLAFNLIADTEKKDTGNLRCMGRKEIIWQNLHGSRSHHLCH